MHLILAFDTATSVGTIALLRDGEVLGERTSRPSHVLAEADRLLAEAAAELADVDGLVVGTGPGSFTGLRLGLAAARGLALATGVPVAGVSTLDALAAGAPGAIPVIDAGRRQVFTFVDGEPRALAPFRLELEEGAVCVGDGAVRYRSVLEAVGARVPPDDDVAHLPRGRFLVLLARDFGPAERVEPLYVRAPDVRMPA